jgi:hypothetical protein
MLNPVFSILEQLSQLNAYFVLVDADIFIRSAKRSCPPPDITIHLLMQPTNKGFCQQLLRRKLIFQRPDEGFFNILLLKLI